MGNSCVLCGAPIEEHHGWPEWMRQFHAVYARRETPALAQLAEKGFLQVYDTFIVADPDILGVHPISIQLARSVIDPSKIPLPWVPEPDSWGFAFHPPCWDILKRVRPQANVDAQQLFDLLRSFPHTLGVVYFGHNYGGLFEYPKTANNLTGWNSDRLWVSQLLNEAACMKENPLDIEAIHHFLAHGHRQIITLGSTLRYDIDTETYLDPFSNLPLELLEYIIQQLPSADVVRLKQASRIYANLDLTESFWQTRFLLGYEFDFVFEALENESRQRGTWKSWYYFIRTMRHYPAFVNRSRIWRLACDIWGLIDATRLVSCAGDPVQSDYEKTASTDEYDWITANKVYVSPATDENNHDPPPFLRKLQVTELVDKVSISSVNIFGRSYVSGLQFEQADGTLSAIGYNLANKTTTVSIVGPIIEFVLAQDEIGIRGIRISSAEDTSSWIGDYKNIPQRRLTLPSPRSQSIKFIKAGLDALKLISLSISDGSLGKDELNSALTVQNSLTWVPEVPDKRLCFLGIEKPSEINNYPQKTISLLLFGDDFLGLVDKMVVRTGRGGQFWGIETYATDDEPPKRLGYHDISWENNMVFELDRANQERIIGIETLHAFGYMIGFKIQTNLKRVAEFPPDAAKYISDDELHSWPLYPENGDIVGFCAELNGECGIQNLGVAYIVRQSL